jgi:hypothetical protein
MCNPTINWVRKSGALCLKFTFNGNFSKHDASEAMLRWKEALSSRPFEKVIHIWDCQNMVDYEQEAKKIWIDNCKELQTQIGTVWLITDSLLICMGARIISLLTYLNIKVVRSEANIHF